MATAAACGAAVMMIEVLGSRVLGPFFGVSLFVWTSLITVTLVALAGGYWAGGRWADRRPGADNLYALVLAAGVLVLAIPYLKSPVLRGAMGLGLRAGSLVASAALFGPALLLLGSVSPYVVRLAARDLGAIGRTVGTFYALSTLGSFAGTLLTGFVLVAWFRVDRIFQVVGAALLVLAAAHFVVLRGKAAAVLLLATALLPGPAPVRDKTLANGTRVTVVREETGHYGTAKVLDYTYGPRRIRELMIDGLIQGGVDTANGLSVYQYPYLLELLPYGINPDGKSCLVLGLGAGVVPAFYGARGVMTDVVDINPAIVDIARREFGFRPTGEVVVADARPFLEACTKRYDYLLMDLANGDWAPAHVLTLEGFRACKARLAPRGILAVNLIGSVRRDTYMTASVVATLRQCFGTVRVFVSADPSEGTGVQNLELVAYDFPGGAFDRSVAERVPIHPMVEEATRRVLGRELDFPAGTPAIVLTDDYNPIDVFDLRVKEEIRRGILGYVDWDLLM